MVVGRLLALLLAACCACAPGVRIVKRREHANVGVRKSGCGWKKHDNMFAQSYAIDPETGDPITDLLSRSQAERRCLGVGSSCQAITCGSADQTCTLRGTALLQPSPDETTWVATCHKCLDLTGNYWTADTNNNTGYRSLFEQMGCVGNMSVFGDNPFAPALETRNYSFREGNVDASVWNPWTATFDTITGYIEGTSGSAKILWSNGWVMTHCPFIGGEYIASHKDEEDPLLLTVTQASGGCNGTWAPSQQQFRVTTFSLHPGFKLRTVFNQSNSEGNAKVEQGLWTMEWDSLWTWRQRDPSTTTVPFGYYFR